MKEEDSSLALLLQIIDSGYNQKAWHGPNLTQSLRGVSAEDAAWRPTPGRHNIWEITVHAAYWKYVVRRRLRRDPRGSFACQGSNWFVRPSSSAHGDEKAWLADKKLLEEEHQKLREAVAALAQAQSRRIPLAHIYGVAFHDVYHAGQIRLLRRLRSDPQMTQISRKRLTTETQRHREKAGAQVSDDEKVRRPTSARNRHHF